jgi:hypothetical protein
MSAHGTLRGELREALETSDSLETFRSLPVSAQENLSRWVDKAADEDSRWRRIEALVLAMRISPLQSGEPHPETGGMRAV